MRKLVNLIIALLLVCPVIAQNSDSIINDKTSQLLDTTLFQKAPFEEMSSRFISEMKLSDREVNSFNEADMRLLVYLASEVRYPKEALEVLRTLRPDSGFWKGNRIRPHLLRPVGQIPVNRDPLHRHREGHRTVVRLRRGHIEQR